VIKKVIKSFIQPATGDEATEPKGVHCGKAQVSSSGSNRVALKTAIVPFAKDSGGSVLGTVLLDSGSETTLIRSGFAKN
jgi:hypothetical protein